MKQEASEVLSFLRRQIPVEVSLDSFSSFKGSASRCRLTNGPIYLLAKEERFDEMRDRRKFSGKVAAVHRSLLCLVD